ncbi:MAG TPA: preprotein translocase subunit SecG [Bacteroidia bacterium]|nr:preprotein translocase subunit SecG [Bacteroidia bacterium]
MYNVIIILIVIVCILLALAVLVQNSKGGGLASGFSSSNQVMGVRRTTDVLEKMTWGLATGLIVLSIAGTMMIPRSTGDEGAKSAIEEQINNAALPSTGLPLGQPEQQQSQQPQPEGQSSQDQPVQQPAGQPAQ